MKSKTWLLVAAVLALVGAGAYYYTTQMTPQTGTEETSDPTAQAPAAEAAAPSTPPPEGNNAAMTNSSPDFTVDESGLSKATVKITTAKGVIKYKFYTKDAPNTVKRMAELIQQGFYNGLTFHRVIPGFVAQGGDPSGDGTGGSGQKQKAEFNARKHIEGTLAMARAADPDSADAQFYIALAPQPHLDNSYTVFGQVVEGMDVVRKIQRGDKMTAVSIE